MMFGTRESFDYVECGACGSLRIAEIPPDLARFYPPEYEAIGAPAPVSRLKAWLTQRWADQSFGRRNLVGAALTRLRGHKIEAEWVLPTGLGRDARVLDVGSGSGAVLRKMRACGFTDLTGVDPFIDADIMEGPGLRIRRGSIDDIDGEYDLVMFNHSLEHIPDQPAALRRAAELLAPGGWILVRIPVVNEAWRRYGVDWVELDAPRHLAIPSPDGMIRLARGAGLAVERVVHDSYDLELWGSEQFRMDIPHFGPASRLSGRGKSPFTRGRMREFRRTIAEWNEACLSGRARFYLRPGVAS